VDLETYELHALWAQARAEVVYTASEFVEKPDDPFLRQALRAVLQAEQKAKANFQAHMSAKRENVDVINPTKITCALF